MARSSFCSSVCPWAIRQIKQPSTIRGLAILAGVVGVNIEPSQVEVIASAAGAIVAAIDVFKNDSK